MICRAEGHVDSRANERTNRPPSAAVARSNRGWHSRYVGFHGSFPRRTHNTPRVMGLRPRPPDDARCIRAPFPRSSIRAAQPAIWSETWYGPGTQLIPFRRLRRLAHSEGCVSLGRHFLKKRKRARVRGPADGRSEPAQDGQDFAGLCGRAHHRGRTGAPVGSRTRFAVHPHPPSTPSNNCGHGGWVWGAWFGLKVRYLLN